MVMFVSVSNIFLKKKNDFFSGCNTFRASVDEAEMDECDEDVSLPLDQKLPRVRRRRKSKALRDYQRIVRRVDVLRRRVDESAARKRGCSPPQTHLSEEDYELGHLLYRVKEIESRAPEYFAVPWALLHRQLTGTFPPP